jgi:hypothetical protein
MSLQLALLLIGIVVVAAVAAASLYRGGPRIALRRSPAVESVPHVLSPRTETGLAPELAEDRLDIRPAAAALAEGKQLRTDATLAAPAESAPEDLIRSEIEKIEEVATMPLDLETDPRRLAMRASTRPATPDELVDFVLNLPGEGPVSRDEALGIYKQHEYELEKPRKLYGKNLDAGYWTELDRDPPLSRYGDLALAIQLVDARGPLGESELNTFAQVGLKLADAFHRPTRFAAGFEAALERAQTLNRFCEAFDVIAAIHVAAPEHGAFHGRDIRDNAQRLGLHFGAMNIFHCQETTATGRHHLFSMASMMKPGEFDARDWEHFMTPGVTLFMSVPCVAHPADVFERMADAARNLATALGGRLLDQDHHPLTGEGLAIIHGQIGEIEQKMRQFGIAPGSPAALRLFGTAAVQEPAVSVHA